MLDRLADLPVTVIAASWLGLPVSSINTVYNNSGTIGPQDGDMLIALNKGHRPTDEFVSQLRRELPRRFPGTTFAFLPADITSQILNFGAPAPIDIQIAETTRANWPVCVVQRRET